MDVYHVVRRLFGIRILTGLGVQNVYEEISVLQSDHGDCVKKPTEDRRATGCCLGAESQLDSIVNSAVFTVPSSNLNFRSAESFSIEANR